MKLTNKIKWQISQYLKIEKKPLICVVWPTWSWKTGFAIEILKTFWWELINADSRQIYKWIENITGLDYDEIKDFPNHLFWIVNIEEKDWTAGKFLQEIRKIIEEIYSRKKIPVIAWWTGLFVSGLIEGFEMPENAKSNKFREQFKEKTKEKLFEELEKVDPESAKKLHPNNRNYIERALEVFYTTWWKKSEWKKDETKAFNALIFHKKIITDKERQDLYEKINTRQKQLFENSIKTVENLKSKIDDFSQFPALNSIGIKEISDFLDWKDKKQEIEKMQKRARNYAKRQMTWWRRKEWVEFF